MAVAMTIPPWLAGAREPEPEQAAFRVLNQLIQLREAEADRQLERARLQLAREQMDRQTMLRLAELQADVMRTAMSMRAELAARAMDTRGQVMALNALQREREWLDKLQQAQQLQTATSRFARVLSATQDPLRAIQAAPHPELLPFAIDLYSKQLAAAQRVAGDLPPEIANEAISSVRAGESIDAVVTRLHQSGRITPDQVPKLRQILETATPTTLPRHVLDRAQQLAGAGRGLTRQDIYKELVQSHDLTPQQRSQLWTELERLVIKPEPLDAAEKRALDWVVVSQSIRRSKEDWLKAFAAAQRSELAREQFSRFIEILKSPAKSASAWEHIRSALAPQQFKALVEALAEYGISPAPTIVPSAPAPAPGAPSQVRILNVTPPGPVMNPWYRWGTNVADYLSQYIER